MRAANARSCLVTLHSHRLTSPFVACAGRLAAEAWPARVLTLALSDVIGDEPTVIGSGPTVGDPSTRADCLSILTRRRLHEALPVAVVRRLQREGEGAETPAPDDRVFSRSQAFVVASNALAVDAAAARARALGLRPLVLSSSMAGEASEVAGVLASVLRECSVYGRPAVPPCAVIVGGETTVTLPPRCGGRGGRNQELALAAAPHLRGIRGSALASVGTDGTDGPTDAAGGVVTEHSADALGERELGRALAAHDAYAALQALSVVDAPASASPRLAAASARVGGLLRTGPTGTNVMDLMVAVCLPAGECLRRCGIDSLHGRCGGCLIGPPWPL